MHTRLGLTGLLSALVLGLSLLGGPAASALPAPHPGCGNKTGSVSNTTAAAIPDNGAVNSTVQAQLSALG